MSTTIPRVLARLGALLAPVLAVSVAPVAGPVTVRPRIAYEAVALPRQALTTLRAPIRFSMAAVTWEDDRAPSGLKARTSPDGRDWSRWFALETPLDAAPDPRSRENRGRNASSPLWAPGSRFVQVRFPAAVPRGATVHFVDPGPDPVRVAPARAASAVTTEPPIVSRAEWGADESLRRTARPDYASRVKMAFVHHTATANDYAPQDAAAIVRSIYAFHVRTNGWDDIGYNFLVDRYGRIFEGRFGGIQKAVVGAHSSGFNTGATGVAVIGTFAGAEPPAEATQALRQLLTWKLDVHHVDPTARVMMRSGGNNKFAEGVEVNLDAISGHRDAVVTECPGDALHALLPSVRVAVDEAQPPKIYEASARYPLAFTPDGDGRADTIDVRATVRGGATWSVEVRDRHDTVVGGTTGAGSAIAFTWDGKSSGSRLPHGIYTVRLSAADASGTKARDADVPVLLASWPHGSVVRPAGGGTVFAVADGTLRPYASPSEFLSSYAWSDVADVPFAVRDAYPTAGRPGYREGSLLRTPGGAVWIVASGIRRSFNSAADFERLGYRWDAIVDVTLDEAAVHSAGPPVDAGLKHPDGTLVRASGPAVYWLQNAMRRPVPSAVIFGTWFRWNEVVAVTDQELALYPAGDQVTFRDGSLLRVGQDPAVYLVSQGRRRPISSVQTFDALGLRWDNVRSVTEAEAATAALGEAV